MSSEDKLKTLRNDIYIEYEFWLGNYEKDKPESGEIKPANYWKSGIIHAYRNVLAILDHETVTNIFTLCPCHVCQALLESRQQS